jgi:hypothetical protein
MTDTTQIFENINQLSFVTKDGDPIAIFHDDNDIEKHGRKELVIHFTNVKSIRDLVMDYAIKHTS